MSRTSLKTNIGFALSSTAADRLIGSLTGIARLPLNAAYHRVVDDLASERVTATPAMAVSRATFERQLDWIGRRYRFVSLDEVGARLESGGTWRTPVATVTFDDGYADVYHHAFPVLQRKGIPAAVFVVTDWIGSSAPFTHDRLYRSLSRTWRRPATDLAPLIGCRVGDAPMRSPFAAMRFLLATRSQRELQHVMETLEPHADADDSAPAALRALDWDMLETMYRAGITIGSHTKTHPLLPNEDASSTFEELKTSRSALGRRLNTSIDHFAYPDGAFDPHVVRAVATAGYRFAYTACRHRDPDFPLLTIPRRFYWENSCLDSHGRFSPSVMSCLANGVYDLVASPCPRRGHTPSHRRRGAAAGTRELR